MNPLVSIIVPNYNHVQFLQERLDSILSQSFWDYDLIILDDASTDHSKSLISRYLHLPKITFLPSASNSGTPFAQWNKGVAAARGRYIWIAESDDYCQRTLLAKLVHTIQKSPDTAIAYCQSHTVDRDGSSLGKATDGHSPESDAFWRQEWYFSSHNRADWHSLMLWRNPIPNASAVLFRRDIYLQAGGAPEAMRLAGDWMCWAKMSLFGSVRYIPEPLNYFRKHPLTVRATTTLQREFEERWEVQKLLLGRGQIRREDRRKLARYIVSEHWFRMRSAPRPNRLRFILRDLRRFRLIYKAAPIESLRVLFFHWRQQWAK